jgi:hypothetical protein
MLRINFFSLKHIEFNILLTKQFKSFKGFKNIISAKEKYKGVKWQVQASKQVNK